MRRNVVRARAWFSAAPPLLPPPPHFPSPVSKFASFPPPNALDSPFDLLAGKFLTQSFPNQESESLCSQLLLFDLAQQDSIRLASVRAHLAKLGQKDVALCEKIELELQSRGEVKSPRVVSNSSEQLDCSSIPLNTLVTSLETMSLLGGVFDFTKCSKICQDLCNREIIPPPALVLITSSLERMNHFDRPLCEYMAMQMVNNRVLAQLSLHDLCAVLLTFTKFDFRHALWLEHVTGELMVRNLQPLSLGTFCQVIRSLSTLRILNRSLTRHLVDELFERDSKQFSNSELVLLMESFVMAKQRSQRFFELVTKELLQREAIMAELEFEELNSLMHSFAMVKNGDKALLRLFSNEIIARDLTQVENDDTLVVMLNSLRSLRHDSAKSIPKRRGNKDDDEDDEEE
ncbi:hypothetical protein BASA81_006824 [Batrachochytrium salamandrivorans]|nr:hypothetical protein BASA81_006824 [Batrachochytrium salamandrivorans]